MVSSIKCLRVAAHVVVQIKRQWRCVAGDFCAGLPVRIDLRPHPLQQRGHFRRLGEFSRCVRRFCRCSALACPEYSAAVSPRTSALFATISVWPTRCVVPVSPATIPPISFIRKLRNRGVAERPRFVHVLDQVSSWTRPPQHRQENLERLLDSARSETDDRDCDCAE